MFTKKKAEGQNIDQQKKGAAGPPPKSAGIAAQVNELIARFKGGKAKGSHAEPLKNACPQCGTAFMPWISFCTRCKVPLKD